MSLLLISILLAFTAGCPPTRPRRPEPSWRRTNSWFVWSPRAYRLSVGTLGTLASCRVDGPTRSERSRVDLRSHESGAAEVVSGHPGHAATFDNAELDRLVPAVQEALAKATPDETVVFLRTRNPQGPRAETTSGTLSVHDEVLSVAVSNFRHPVRTAPSDVGAIDRLSDVRETLGYVRGSPWISVGEQDFAVFFDDQNYQVRHPVPEVFSDTLNGRWPLPTAPI